MCHVFCYRSRPCTGSAACCLAAVLLCCRAAVLPCSTLRAAFFTLRATWLLVHSYPWMPLVLHAERRALRTRRRFGRLAVVRLLLDARADMLVVNAEGTSAIAIAQLGKGASARPYAHPCPHLHRDWG